MEKALLLFASYLGDTGRTINLKKQAAEAFVPHQPLAVFSVLPTGPVKKNLTFLAVDLWSLYWSLLCRTKRLASR